MHKKFEGRARGLAIAVLATAATLAFATTASATLEPISSVTLQSGGGTALWDAETEYACLPGVLADSPVANGSFNAQSDAFDGGLLLNVFAASPGYVGFSDGDGQGNHVGQSLTIGPRTLLGLRVTRTDTGLPGSPTLRSLVKLTNTTNHKLTRAVSLCSNLGSDAASGVRASSNGDHKLTAADRWVVTSDSATTAVDPPVTHVFSGKGALRVTKTGFCAPTGAQSDCVGQELKFTLGGGKTRYLLFYAEMHGTNGSAITGASKYNNKNLTAALRSGLSQTVRSRVLNWDLG